MRKKTGDKLRSCILTLAVAAVVAGVPAVSAHAEELATDTDAVTEEAQTDSTGEEVSTDEVTVEASDAPYYNINVNGGTFDGTYYRLGGQVIASAFFSDGTYTYYLQADGTTMKDKLTYHPDGVHVIYFDANGHEVFSDFANVKKSIAGDEVDDLCFFDVYGYMYVNKLTYNKEGTKLYYVNEYGVIERNGWFQFPYYIEGLSANSTYEMVSDDFDGLYGYGNSDGTLMTNTWTYNWNNQAVYLQGNGSTAKGLHNIGGVWCLFDANDAHLIQQTASRPYNATLTRYHSQDMYTVITYNGNEKTETGYVDGQIMFNDVYIYDEYGREITGIIDEQTRSGEYQKLYYGDSNRVSYYVFKGDTSDGYVTTERYYNNDSDNCLTGARGTKIWDNSDGTISGKAIWESVYYEGGKNYKFAETLYYGSGAVNETITYTYTLDGSYVFDDIRYDESGNVISHYIRTYTYNSDGSAICETKGYDISGNVTSHYIDTYDKNGKLVSTV